MTGRYYGRNSVLSDIEAHVKAMSNINMAEHLGICSHLQKAVVHLCQDTSRFGDWKHRSN